MLEAYFHGDIRNKKREKRKYEYLSLDELKQLPQNGHCLVKADDGEVLRMKVTSVKTWKTREDVRLRIQYGLYQHYEFLFTPEKVNETFVKEIL